MEPVNETIESFPAEEDKQIKTEPDVVQNTAEADILEIKTETIIEPDKADIPVKSEVELEEQSGDLVVNVNQEATNQKSETNTEIEVETDKDSVESAIAAGTSEETKYNETKLSETGKAEEETISTDTGQNVNATVSSANTNGSNNNAGTSTDTNGHDPIERTVEDVENSQAEMAEKTAPQEGSKEKQVRKSLVENKLHIFHFLF